MCSAQPLPYRDRSQACPTTDPKKYGTYREDVHGICGVPNSPAKNKLMRVAEVLLVIAGKDKNLAPSSSGVSVYINNSNDSHPQKCSLSPLAERGRCWASCIRRSTRRRCLNFTGINPRVVRRIHRDERPQARKICRGVATSSGGDFSDDFSKPRVQHRGEMSF